MGGAPEALDRRAEEGDDGGLGGGGEVDTPVSIFDRQTWSDGIFSGLMETFSTQVNGRLLYVSMLTIDKAP